MNHNTFAVVAIFGVNLPFSGPVVSAWMSWKPPTPNSGRSATVSATIPMPPSQWDWQRHRLILLGRDSMSERMVAPVVVNPLTLSKTASVIDGIAPLENNGRAPKRLAKIQPSATTIKLPRGERVDLILRPVIRNNNATSQLHTIGMMNAPNVCSS